MTRIVKLSDGLRIGSISVSYEEQTMIKDRAGAVHYGGCPVDLLDAFEDEQPGAIDYAVFVDWLIDQAVD